MSKTGSANGSSFDNVIYDQLLRRRPQKGRWDLHHPYPKVTQPYFEYFSVAGYLGCALNLKTPFCSKGLEI
jgi:hypothetical protein